MVELGVKCGFFRFLVLGFFCCFVVLGMLGYDRIFLVFYVTFFEIKVNELKTYNVYNI